MNNVEYKFTTGADIEMLMDIRLEMLREVNGLTDDYVYDESFVNYSRDYFLNGDQTTIVALDERKAIGCASISYVTIMPTFDHPSGQRAHLMNVYVAKSYRGRGIASRMLDMLVDEARQKGVTEISLDTTDAGRILYESFGFTDSQECMVLEL